MECVLCGVDDIAEPIAFVHFLLFDLMGKTFPDSYKRKQIAVTYAVTLNALIFHVKMVLRAKYQGIYCSVVISPRETNKPLKRTNKKHCDSTRNPPAIITF